MVMLVDGGDDAFRAIVYHGHPRQNAPISNTPYGASVLTEAAQSFFQHRTEIYRVLDESETARLTRAAIRKVASFWQMDGVQPLQTIGQLQQANLTMQRLVMAEPTVRALYHNQGCDGYSDSYVDNQPKVIGKAHYDYRRATNSLFMEREGVLEATTYYEDLHEGDKPLTAKEKADVQISWNHMRALILKRGEDPTDKYNNRL